MDLSALKAQWQNQGFCVLPGFLTSAQVDQLRAIGDRVLQQCLDALDPQQKSNLINIAYLTEPHYFTGDRASLLRLLEFIAHPQILDLLQFLFAEPVLFHNTQYFFPPIERSRPGQWHRDTQFLAPDPELERLRIEQTIAVHFRVALLPDDCLEYVPGSEKRWDTPAEYAIRKHKLEETHSSDAIAGSQRIALKPGDGLLFHAWGIHRGTYEASQPRRTLDVIYQIGQPCDYYPPPATCFRQAELLQQLSPAARSFFEDFIRTYDRYWDK